MATKTCKNGHQYDSSIYGDNCPFCPSEGGETRVSNNGNPFDEPPTQETRQVNNNWGPANNNSWNNPTDATMAVGDDGGGHTVIRTLGGDNPGLNADGGRRLVGVLVSYSANPSGEVYKIYEGRNIVGRAHSADISFPNDSHMSGNHLLILYVEAEGIVWAEDQKSSNGTYINGRFARGMVELKTNDIIVVGSTKLVFLGIPKF